MGIVAGPPKIPKDITDKLVNAFKVAITDPEFQKFVRDRASNPMYLPPDQAIKYVDEQRRILRQIMEKVGILKEK